MSETESVASSAQWRRSSRCSTGGCVEVALVGDTVLVRDSKLDGSPILQFDRNEWHDFRQGILAGDFTFGRPA